MEKEGAVLQIGNLHDSDEMLVQVTGWVTIAISASKDPDKYLNEIKERLTKNVIFCINNKAEWELK